RLTAHERGQRFPFADDAATALAGLLRHARPLRQGERSVRARLAQLMYTLYPAEPARSRREFNQLVERARRKGGGFKRERGRISTSPRRASWTPFDEPEDCDPHQLPGTPYRLRCEIGRGSSSVVYDAEHVELGRRAAVKVLAPEHTHSPHLAARFRREARSLSRLQHPGLVRVFDFGQTSDGRLYYAMELLEGRSLREELRGLEGPMPWPRALELIREACRALSVAHRRGLVHRDIKPDNLFLQADGHLKIIDFGLALNACEVDEEQHADGESLHLYGTPAYMAPEQAARGVVDARADVYSLGCVLYEMLTGRLPFEAKGELEVIRKKMEGGLESIRHPSIPRSVSRLVSTALARHARRRFEDVDEMAAAIEDALYEPGRRRRQRRMLGGALLGAVMTGGLALLGATADPWLRQLPAQLPWLEAEPTATPPRSPIRTPPPPRPDAVRNVRKAAVSSD
ncbi:MAG: serine/threonine-protein kinase, partial [Myxococcota bacterium]